MGLRLNLKSVMQTEDKTIIKYIMFYSCVIPLLKVVSSCYLPFLSGFLGAVGELLKAILGF